MEAGEKGDNSKDDTQMSGLSDWMKTPFIEIN